MPSPRDARPPARRCRCWCCTTSACPAASAGRVASLFLNRLDYGSHPWLARLRGLRVSAHFFIRRDGAVIQFVSTEDRAGTPACRATRAGNAATTFPSASSWRAPTPCPTPTPSTRPCASWRPLRARYPLAAAWGHEHIAPGRKTDPASFQLDALRARKRLRAAATAARLMRRLITQGTDMLKIWGRLTSVNVQKVMLAVRELALPHEFIRPAASMAWSTRLTTPSAIPTARCR